MGAHVAPAAGAGFVALGFALIAWILYDATSVQETLRLAAVVDEATVALLGLALGLTLIAVGIAAWLRARPEPPAPRYAAASRESG